jgi:single-stranded-DNA-specific exonuclease
MASQLWPEAEPTTGAGDTGPVPAPEPHLPTLAPAEMPCLPGAGARQLGRALGLSLTIAEVLHRRGYGDAQRARRFLEPRLAHLTSPEQMADRDTAAARLARAVRKKERICVFGDYDCDGITATATLVEVLRALGGEAVALLSSRFDGGYGVSRAATARILDSGAQLLVTCDCGSSDHQQLERVRAHGLDVLVIDHHLVPDEPLPAVAFLNPNRPDCGYPYKNLASCGLVLSLAGALRKELGQELDLRAWLDLVAIGTVADVAPLDGDNRVLVRVGLERLAQANRPGIRALLELARLAAGGPVTSDDVAFRLAPRLNTPGRLGPPDPALALLLADSEPSARSLALSIEQLCADRKQQQGRMLEQAVEQVERKRWSSRPALVVGRKGWNHGLAGIVAARLTERYRCPVIAIGFDERGDGRGSVRGPAGWHLHDALCAARDVLTRFGGHQAAAGVEVPWERLAQLRERFEQACAQQAAGDQHRNGVRGAELFRLSPEDSLAGVLRDLERLEPCGQGNPAPKIVVDGRVISARQVRGGHLKVELGLPSGVRLSVFGAGLGDCVEQARAAVAVAGTLRRDRWRGGDAVEMKLERVVG